MSMSRDNQPRTEDFKDGDKENSKSSLYNDTLVQKQ